MIPFDTLRYHLNELKMSNSPVYYKIKWRCLFTNFTGEGMKDLSYNRAKYLIKQLNIKYKNEIDHWIE